MQPGRRERCNALPSGNGQRVKGWGAFGFHDECARRSEYIDRVLQSFLQTLKSSLPSQCAVCQSWPAAPVCNACTARFANRNLRCRCCALVLPATLPAPAATHLPRSTQTTADVCIDCVKQPPPVDATLAALNYAYPWSGLISAYKFGEQTGWASFFASLLLTAPGVGQALAGLQPTDLILPVPLSKERLQTRGFNQAWEIAAALASQSGSPARASSTLLLRVKNTRPQTELKREARLDNVKGAFQIDPLRAAELKGKRVVLIDDVMTSGASLFTAASVIRSAGAAHITGIVLARTPV